MEITSNQIKKNCLQCGSEFILHLSKAHRKYCSIDCWEKARYHAEECMYPPEWTESLKTKIRERDNYTCKLCNEKQSHWQLPPVHHIDYNKKNCNETNLITLCMSCHGKTNGGDHLEWIKLFKGDKN